MIIIFRDLHKKHGIVTDFAKVNNIRLADKTFRCDRAADPFEGQYSAQYTETA